MKMPPPHTQEAIRNEIYKAAVQVALRHKMFLATILCRSKAPSISHVRHAAMFECYEKVPGATLKLIAEFFGTVPGAVIYARKVHQERMN